MGVKKNVSVIFALGTPIAVPKSGGFGVEIRVAAIGKVCNNRNRQTASDRNGAGNASYQATPLGIDARI
jgi:hypothetical protein